MCHGGLVCYRISLMYITLLVHCRKHLYDDTSVSIKCEAPIFNSIDEVSLFKNKDGTICPWKTISTVYRKYCRVVCFNLLHIPGSVLYTINTAVF